MNIHEFAAHPISYWVGWGALWLAGIWFVSRNHNDHETIELQKKQISSLQSRVSSLEERRR